MINPTGVIINRKEVKHNMRKLMENTHAVIDMSIVIMIGIAFAALIVIAYIIWTVNDLLAVTPSATTTTAQNETYYSLQNITTGFDSAVSLLLVAITIFILAIAISALLMLRGR